MCAVPNGYNVAVPGLDGAVAGWSQHNKRSLIMMNGWMAGGMWMWMAIGVLVLVVLVIVIIKLLKK